MAIRKPLIIDAGEIKELPASDSLDVTATQTFLVPVVEMHNPSDRIPELVCEENEFGHLDVVCEYTS